MSESEEPTELCRSGEYRVFQMFDMALLGWPHGELIVGDHSHTDPQCAVINPARGWCVTSGQGLEICHFEDGLPRGPKEPGPNRVKRLTLWRNQNPPPDGREYWFVGKIWHDHEDIVRVLINPSPGDAALCEVDVRTLRWKRL